jgi:hypothetical protein
MGKQQLVTFITCGCESIAPFCNSQSEPTATSSTTKTGRHYIAKILLKVELTHQKSYQANHCDIMRTP